MRSVLGCVAAALAVVGAAAAQTQEPFEVAAADDGSSETVTVTAQRMETHASDPVAASVVTEKEARLRATSSRANLLRKVPGVTVLDLGNRSANIVIRGTATAPDGDPNGAASATYFGDIPLSGLSGAALTQDLATYDMDRTEVLRGPQGTSYGAGALSGAVRNVPNAAELDVLEGSFSTALKSTRGGSAFGYDTDGFVNVPLIDDMLAARIVGYAYRDDNPIHSLLDGRSGSDNETWGARAALRFEPLEDFTLNIHYVHEENDLADLTRIESNRDFATSEYRAPGDRTIDLVYGRADWDLGFATATWIGSYSSGEIGNVYNYGAWYTDVTGASTIDADTISDEENVTQELRFSAVDRKRFDWLIGVYYDERTSDSLTRYLLSGTDTQAVTEWDSDGIDDPELPNLVASIYDTKEEQLAFYGEASWWFENGVGITAGVRHVRYEQSEAYLDVPEGEVPDGAPELLPWFPTFEAWWPKLNVSWQRNANEFYYVQYASAERPGGTNFGFFDDTCPPEIVERVEDVYEGDEIRTLEGGAKLFDQGSGIAVNGSVYYSRWKNAPTYNAVNCGGVALSYIDNAGEVELYGIEIEAFAPLAEGLTADLTFAWGIAEIAENDPTYTGGVKGDALPGSPEWKVSLSFDYEREIGSGLTLIAGGGVAYTGSYPNGLSGDWSYYAPFVSFPGFDVGVIGTLPGGTDLYSDPGAGDYALVDANIGIEGEDWAVTLFADNLLDAGGRVAISYLNTTPDGVATLSRVTPRTVGLRVSAEF